MQLTKQQIIDIDSDYDDDDIIDYTNKNIIQLHNWVALYGIDNTKTLLGGTKSPDILIKSLGNLDLALKYCKSYFSFVDYKDHKEITSHGLTCGVDDYALLSEIKKDFTILEIQTTYPEAEIRKGLPRSVNYNLYIETQQYKDLLKSEYSKIRKVAEYLGCDKLYFSNFDYCGLYVVYKFSERV